MAIIPVDNLGQVGIVKDIAPFQLPPNAWSDGNNIRVEHGAIMKSPGYSSVIETCPVAPYHIIQLKAGVNDYWVVGGLNAIHVYDSTSKETAINDASGIDASNTTVTVDSTTDFETNGTITIESEQITYTGKSSTQFTGCTRGANSTSAASHADNITVSRTNKWYDITRGPGAGGAYSANATDSWTSTTIGGVLIMNNGVDEPQFWELIAGVPATVQKMQNLSNWPANTECKSIRSFRSFLVSLNITKSNVPNSRVVKWSTEAGINTVPSSWDETSATVDAGEYSLEETKGSIVDGLPLQDTFMIYKEDSTYAMTYVGTPFIFAFRQLSPTVGALARNCVTEFDGGHFIFGNGDMYVNDGQRIKSILPHKMRDYIFSYIDGEQYKKSFCVTDYNRSEVLACFPSADNISNQCDKALVWNWSNNAFSIRDIPDLAHISYGTIEDETALTTWAAATATWTTVDGIWAVNWNTVENVLVFASPTNTKVYRDRVGFQADGSDMNSYIERTGYTMDEQNNPDQSTVKHIKSIWPKMTIDKDETVNFYIGTQMSTEEAVTWEGPMEFNPDTQSKVSCRVSGKLYGLRIESSSDAGWRLEGLEFDVQNSGRRGSRSY